MRLLSARITGVRMLYECGRFLEIPEMWRIVESATC